VIKDPKQAFEEIERLGLLDAVMTRCFDELTERMSWSKFEKASCDRYRVRWGEGSPWLMYSRWELFEHICKHGLFDPCAGVPGLGELLDLLWDLGYWKDQVATSEAEMARLALRASEGGEYAREIEEMVEDRRARFARPLGVSGWDMSSGKDFGVEVVLEPEPKIDGPDKPEGSNLTGSLSVTDSPSQESVCESEPKGFIPGKVMWGGVPKGNPILKLLIDKDKSPWKLNSDKVKDLMAGIWVVESPFVDGIKVVDFNKLGAVIQSERVQRLVADGYRQLMQGGAPDDLTSDDLVHGAGSEGSNLTGSLSVTDSPSQESVCESELGQSSDENESFEIDPEQVIWRKRDICYGLCRWKDFDAASLVGVYCWSLDRKDTRLYRVVGLEATLVVLRTKNVCFSLEHEDFFKNFCLVQPPYDSKELAAIAEFPIVEEDAGQSSDEADRSDKSDRTDTTGEGGDDHSGSDDQVLGEGSDENEGGSDDPFAGFELPAWPVMCRALSVIKQSTAAMMKHSGLSYSYCWHLKGWLKRQLGVTTETALKKIRVERLREIVKEGLYDRGESAEVSESIVSEIADLGKPSVEVVGRPAAEVVTVDPEKVAVVEKKIALPTLGEPTQYQFAGVSLADKVRVFKKGGVPLLLRPSVVDQFKKMLADHPLLGDAEWCRRRLTIWPNGYKLTMLEGSN